MRIALYPGSFDPITYGHLDVLRRARRLFDELIVAVVENPRKTSLFSAEERKKLVQAALREEGIRDVRVVTYAGLLVDCAKELERWPWSGACGRPRTSTTSSSSPSPTATSIATSRASFS